jgi:hypothetical protein
VANDRYKGWRSTLSATYKAYTTYEEGLRHRLEELDIVEWHYLVLYFGTEEFQVCCHFFKWCTADFIKVLTLSRFIYSALLIL